MQNERMIDDGSAVTEEELRDIRLRAMNTRHEGASGNVRWSADDNVAQALADRARLLRVLDNGGGLGGRDGEQDVVRWSEEALAHDRIAIIGRCRTMEAAVAGIRDYERRWPPTVNGTALQVHGRADVGFLISGTRIRIVD
jgi:hypothetical protein